MHMLLHCTMQLQHASCAMLCTAMLSLTDGLGAVCNSCGLLLLTSDGYRADFHPLQRLAPAHALFCLSFLLTHGVDANWAGISTPAS
jgi:hypothetical protein